MVNGPDPTELRKYLDQRAMGVDKARSIGDKTGVVRVGDRFGMGAEAVRDELAKGWHQEESAHGLIFWYPNGHKTDRKQGIR